MRKPSNITYGLDERPPPAVLLSAALQQTAIVLVFGFPAIVVAREAGATPAEAAGFLGLTYMVCGLSALIQAFGGRFGLGSGYLVPGSGAASLLPPSILAAQAGGLPLVAGMTAFAGLAGVLLARVLHRLRALLPPEIAGAVVLIIGVVIALTGVRSLMQTPDGAPPEAAAFAVTAVTMAVAGGLSVWGKGLLRFICVAIGMAAGSLAAWLLGLLRVRPDFDPAALPLMGLPPLAPGGWAFDLALLPAFAVGGLAIALKNVGLVTTLQRINDADWVRPEPRSIAGGVTGDGVAGMLAGLVGAHGTTLSPTNVMVQQATGVTSRAVALGTAALCALLACFPRVAALLSQVPAPVIAGVLIHAGGLMLVNGMQLATSRMLDARRSLAVGLAVVAALAVEATPQVTAWVPAGMRPLFSAIAFGTLVAVGLNALLRIGVRKRVSLTVPGDAIEEQQVADFASRAGASWGARADVVARATEVVSWCLDAIIQAGLARGDVTVTLAFDEFRLDLVISYRGAPIELASAPPSAKELLEEEGAGARLAGHMIRRRSDRASVSHREGLTELRLVVDH